MKRAEAGTLKMDRQGSCVVIMAAVSMVIASTAQIHLHTQSLCSFCSEQTTITQRKTALLARQRHFPELDASSLGSRYRAFVP